MNQLILKRAAASRLSGEWNDDDYDVLADGVVVGRIFNAAAAPVRSPWMWTLAFGHHEDRSRRTATNYGAAILAAIYVIKLSGVPHSQTYLKILAGVTAVAGSGFLLWIQCNIVGTRYRLDDVHKNFFTSNELEAVGWSDKEIRKLSAICTLMSTRPWYLGCTYNSTKIDVTICATIINRIGANWSSTSRPRRRSAMTFRLVSSFALTR
jgi:hypothetical protein